MGRLLVPATVLALAAALAGCTSRSGQVAGRLIAPADRVAAPVLSGTTTGGAQLDLAGYTGDVVVLNFWGSWCGPCRAEAAELDAVAAATGPLGVRFVGVDEKDTASAAETFRAARHVGYPSLYDGDGGLMARYPSLPSVPATVLIDRRGRVAERFIGPVVRDTLLAAVQQVAAESAQAAS